MSDGTPEHDLRLLPTAVFCWAAAATGLLWAWWWVFVLGATVVLPAAWFAVRGADSRRRAACWVLVVAGLAVTLLMGPRLRAAAEHPLRAAAANLTSVTATLRVTERPRQLYSAGFGGQPGGVHSVLVPAEVQYAEMQHSEAAARVVRDGELVVLAPARGWDALLPGQRLVTAGSLAPARDIDLTVAALRVHDPPRLIGGVSWWQRAAESVRTGLRVTSTAALDPAPGGLLPGLVDGDTSALPHDVREEFLAAGLSHLTAVSGSNLAIVCGAVLLALRALRVGPRCAAGGAGVALAGFVVLAGPEPSVLRAAVMGAIGLLALATGRAGAALPALAATVLVLVLYDPGLAVSIGFVLSALATAGLVVLAPRLAGAMGGWGVPASVAAAVAVPAAAQLVTAPVIAGFAGQVNVAGIGANLVAAPVVAPVTVLGVLAALCAPWFGAAAGLLVHLAGPGVSWLVTVAHVASGLPGAVLDWPTGWLGGALLALLLIALLFVLRLPRLRVLVLAAAVGALLVFVPITVISPGWPPSGWAMVSCDVGQGDSEVLSTGVPGRAVVVDAGPEADAVDGCLDRLGVTEVPLVVLSHLHADHVGGLAGVLDGRAVGAVALGRARDPAWAWREIQRQAAAAHVPLVELRRGQRIAWAGLTLDVLGPVPADEYPLGDAESGTAVNNTSVVLRADTTAGRVLLPGDVELDAQRDLLSAGTDLTAAVLKIPHHGSKYSLPGFLDAVRARVAVAGVGVDNGYGHPSPVTMDRLQHDGALTARTDLDGDVAVLPGATGPRLVRRGSVRR